MKTKTKRIKAKRMYAPISKSRNIGYWCANAHSVEGLANVPVAVLDVSDEAALIEQVARALHGGSWTYDVGEEFTREPYRDNARAVLESLGIIKSKSRK